VRFETGSDLVFGLVVVCLLFSVFLVAWPMGGGPFGEYATWPTTAQSRHVIMAGDGETGSAIRNSTVVGAVEGDVFAAAPHVSILPASLSMVVSQGLRSSHHGNLNPLTRPPVQPQFVQMQNRKT
jgi:hypothetical protein